MQAKTITNISTDDKHFSLLCMIFNLSSGLSPKIKNKILPSLAQFESKQRKETYFSTQFTEIWGDSASYYGTSKSETFFLNPSILLTVIRTGVPRSSLPMVVDCYPLLASQDSFFKALDVSRRTLHRYSTEGAKGALLSTNQGERVAQLVGMIELAREVLGSKDEAEIWLNSKAVGLGGQRPMELMDTSAGASLVKTLLEQMKYGVYA